MTPGLLLQTLTNLAIVSPGAGLPAGWQLAHLRRAEAPVFGVTRAHTLSVEATSAAGVASHRLAAPPLPREGSGQLTWRWRTGTPLPQASIRVPSRDNSPARVVVLFDDGRTLLYTWGNTEPVGDRSGGGPSGRRAIVVCRRADDANGSWYLEAHDPFSDYRRAFARAPHPIVSIGVGADTDLLGAHSVAEVSDVSWE